MKPLLRFLTLLVAWAALFRPEAALGQTPARAQAGQRAEQDRPATAGSRAGTLAPRLEVTTLANLKAKITPTTNAYRPTGVLAVTANNVTTGPLPGANGATVIADFSGTYSGSSQGPTSYTFVTFPTAAQGLLYGYNNGNGTFIQIIANNQNISAVTYPNLVFDPSGTSPGNVAFNYSITDNKSNVSNTAVYTIQVANAVPTARAQTSQILISSFGPTTLSQPLSGTDTDGTITSFTIASIPAAAAGVLALGGTAVTVGQSIPAAQAGQLTFDPLAGYFGTAQFTYSAVDNTGNASPASGYGIPVSKQGCPENRALDFSTRAQNENWAAGATATVQGVTITSSGYTAPAGQTSLLVNDLIAAPGKGLIWDADYTTTAASTSSVTFTFSRPLTGFSLTVADIDRLVGTQNDSGWEDQLTIDGYTAANVKVVLAAADVAVSDNATNVYSGNNIVTGTSSNAGPRGNIVVTFPQAISSIIFTYRNLQTTQPNPGGQFVSFPSFSWCAEADVTTTLAGPRVLNAGQPSGTYTAAFTNNGPSTASAVTQRVVLPAGVSSVFVNGSPFTPVAGIIDFGTAATLASGATNQFTFSFTAPSAVGAVTVASIVGTATGQGANTAADEASLSPTVNATANVATIISSGTAAVLAGQTGTFNVIFSNNGPQTAAGVVAAVQLPAGLVGVTATNGGVYNSTTGVVSYTGLTSQISGASTASAITFTMPATGPVTAAATTSTSTNEAGQTANNAASAFIDVTPVYDVTTVITGPATTAVGVQTTFSISTLNNGPSVAPMVVQTVTGLPTNLSNVYVSNGGTYNAGLGTVTFPALTTLANGARADNTISFTPTTATGFTATATVVANTNNANDSNTANNTVAAPATAVNAAPAATPNTNLYTTITNPEANVAPGVVTTFAVTSGNDGPGTATSVVQLVTLPAGLSMVVVRDGNNVIIPGAYNATTGLVTFPSLTSLSSSTSAKYTIEVRVPDSGVLAAVATISAATADVMPSNNIATADVTVAPATDVTVRLTGPNTAAAGSPATYTVTTTNNGPATATGVVTTVSIPAGLSGVTVSGGGTYNATTGAVSFPATASLLNGNSVANTITYTMPSLATFANVALVTSTTPDNVLANNTAAVTTVTEPLTDVTVTLSGPATIVQGNQVDYVLSATNNGPAAASNVAIQVQLPAGLGAGNVASTGGTYDNTTGVLTFPSIASQLAGTDGAISYGIRFIAPATLTSLNPSASISTSSEESSYANNVSTIATTATPATTAMTDLQIVVAASTTTPVAGEPLTLTVTTNNLTSATTATNVVQRVSLQPGLAITSITNGGTYNSATGVVTFPTLATVVNGTPVVNTIVLKTPGMSPLTVRGLVTGDQTDAAPANNLSLQNLTVTQRADVTTALTGPATAQPGDLVTYSVVTLNNGPSIATGVVQTVTLPAGATNVVISGGGVQSGNTVTFPAIANQVAGQNGQVLNTISFNNPVGFTTSYDVVANVTTTSVQPTPPGTTNDVATFTTTKGNRAPVANAVTNVLQGPEGNTAGPLLISSLSGTDADGNGTIASYTITSIPDALQQGTLRLNGTAVTVNQIIVVADIAKLTFDPLSTFTGNAFFTYTVLDNAGAVSAPAVYTIPIGQDIISQYGTTPVKGGTTANGFSKYAANDVIAFVSDVNAARYNSTGQLYDATTGALASGAANGLATTGTNATTDAAGTTLLAAQGLVLNAATGQITVNDPKKLTAGTYTVNITTTDLYGGVTTQPVTYTIGARPLPVELTAFEATAKNLDALLTWTTASEKNNDHFDVERSLNGTDFVKTDEVRGQGTSTSATNYTRTDAGIGAKVNGLVYYRLKQVDTDGTSSYSLVRNVRFGKVVAPAIALFPNPATTATNLDLTALPAGSYQVSVLDAAGRTVLTTTLNAGLAHALQLNTIASGSYTLLVRGTNGGQVVNLAKRLIKE